MTTKQENILKDTLTVLIDCLNDKDAAVNYEIIKSLNKIASAHPNDVIAVFCEYLQNKPNLINSHIENIVRVLEQTCVHIVKRLTAESLADLLAAMLQIMTASKDYVPGVQMGASSVLVALGHQHHEQIIQRLAEELKSDAVPHYTIPHTLGTLSAINTHNTVPHVKDLLSKMIPLLTLVKTDAMKQAFAYAFGHFAVAISELIVENEQNISLRDSYHVEFSVIFDVLFNQWLGSHEPKVTESILEALGPIARLVPDKKFEEISNKFISSLLSIYKRSNVDNFYVSQCISYLLTPSPLNPKLSFTEHILHSINCSLFQWILLEPDYDQPQSVKNHFEVLRCFDYLSGQFPDSTIDFLFQNCKNNQEKERMRAVIALTHLTTSSHIFVDKYASRFVAILKVMLSMEQNVKMKKILVKAIVALIYRNCLLNNEDFVMTEFIIRNCSFEAPANISRHDIEELHDTCKNSLFLLSNTVTNVKSSLRGLFLKALVSDDLMGSCTTVAHCLTHLLQANGKDSSDDKSDTVENANAVFVRCFVFLIDPLNVDRNKKILQFLEEYSGEVHKNLKVSWQVDIQRLLKYVDKNQTNEQWHQMLLELLVSAVEHVNNDNWVETITTLFSEQIVNRKQLPIMKGVCLQYLSVLISYMTKEELVNKFLNIITAAIRTAPIEGSDYLCRAIGITARHHGLKILIELNILLKEVQAKKGSTLFNFISNKHSRQDMETGVFKYTLIMSYGQVAKESPDEKVLIILADEITPVISNFLRASPNMDLTRACLTSLYHIAKALQPPGNQKIVLRNRWPLLNVVLDQLFNENLKKRNVEIYPLIVKAAKSLTKLQKGISPEERNTILRVLITSVFNELAAVKKKFELDENEITKERLTENLNDSIAMLRQLIQEFVLQATCLSTIDDLVSLIGEWLNNEDDEIRKASVQLLHIVFETYIKNVKINYETPSKFTQMGFLLGLILPGCTDYNFSVRLLTIDNVKLIMQIHELYEGLTVDADSESMSRLSAIQNNILTNDLNMIADYCTSLTEAVVDKIPHQQSLQFIDSLLSRFQDVEVSAVGISSILDTFLKKKGQDLYQSVEKIMDLLLACMEGVEDGEGGARLGSMSTYKLMKPLGSLARHHSNAVTAVLLAQPLPLRRSIVKCWRYLAQDINLSTSIVENFLRMMTSIELFEHTQKGVENPVAALQPLMVVCAMGELFGEENVEDICVKKFPEIFAMLYTTMACYTGCSAPAYSMQSPPANKAEYFGFIPNRESIKLSPAKITLATFSSFLARAKCEKMKEACSLFPHTETGEPLHVFLELVPVLVGMLCREAAQHVARVVSALAPYARSPVCAHRVAVLAFLGELLNYRCNDNPVLMEAVMATLNSGWKDNDNDVKVISIKGMANICQLKNDFQHQYLPSVLSALSQGVDDIHNSHGNGNVPLAAVQGLSRLLTEAAVVTPELHRELLPVAQKIKPFMNTESAVLREASIRLFGVLAGRMAPAGLQDQALASLPCFLLHLCDENQTVVRASKFTLKKVFVLFETKTSNNMVQTHLLEEGNLYYDEFLQDLLRNFTQELPSSINTLIDNSCNYLNSPQSDIRAYGSLLIGILYSQLKKLSSSDNRLLEEADQETRRHIVGRLLQLLRDSDANVRRHAALALAHVCLATDDSSALDIAKSAISSQP